VLIVNGGMCGTEGGIDDGSAEVVGAARSWNGGRSTIFDFFLYLLRRLGDRSGSVPCFRLNASAELIGPDR
jgi:hypothetical protein